MKTGKKIVFVLLFLVGIIGCDTNVTEESPKLDSDRIELDKASKLIREYAFKETPNMNSNVKIPITEITTPEVFQRLGFKVFKCTPNADVRGLDTFIIKENQVFFLATGFGGEGLQSMCVADLDNNGKAELIFTYSSGSGLHRTELGICYNEQSSLKIVAIPVEYYRGDLFVRKENDQNVVVEIGKHLRELGKYNVLAKLGAVKAVNQNGKLSYMVEEDPNIPEEFKENIIRK
jgi:hypothetical protein